MRYHNINAFGLIVFLLVILFGMSAMVLDMGLDAVGLMVERLEMIRDLRV